VTRSRYPAPTVYITLAALLLLALATATLVGSAVPAGNAFAVARSDLHLGATDLDPAEQDTVRRILWQIRLPRALLGALVGAALAVAGAVMQGFFRNPMADPFIVGVSSGAALGAALAISLGGVWAAAEAGVPVFAFVGAALATLVVYALSRRGGQVPLTTLLLTGLAVGSLMAALTSIVVVISDAGEVRKIVFWLMGSLSLRGYAEVRMMLPYVVVGFGLVLLFARDLNVLSLGDESAKHLGLETERIKFVLLLLASLLAAAAVAVSGVIAFVGLVVPHLLRLLIGPDHRALIPACALGGAVLLVVADLLARIVVPSIELPVGIMTSLLGCPFFLYLLHRRRYAFP
jgi:iron complex transport system permease protein